MPLQRPSPGLRLHPLTPSSLLSYRCHRGLASPNPLESRKGLQGLRSGGSGGAHAHPAGGVLPQRTFEILHRIGAFLHSDVALLTKVWTDKVQMVTNSNLRWTNVL